MNFDWTWILCIPNVNSRWVVIWKPVWQSPFLWFPYGGTKILGTSALNVSQLHRKWMTCDRFVRTPCILPLSRPDLIPHSVWFNTALYSRWHCEVQKEQNIHDEYIISPSLNNAALPNPPLKRQHFYLLIAQSVEQKSLNQRNFSEVFLNFFTVQTDWTKQWVNVTARPLTGGNCGVSV